MLPSEDRFLSIYDEKKPMKWWEHIIPVHGFIRGVPRYIEKYKAPSYEETDNEFSRRIDKKLFAIGCQVAYLASLGILAASLSVNKPSSLDTKLQDIDLQKTNSISSIEYIVTNPFEDSVKTMYLFDEKLAP